MVALLLRLADRGRAEGPAVGGGGKTAVYRRRPRHGVGRIADHIFIRARKFSVALALGRTYFFCHLAGFRHWLEFWEMEGRALLQRRWCNWALFVCCTLVRDGKDKDTYLGILRGPLAKSSARTHT